MSQVDDDVLLYALALSTSKASELLKTAGVEATRFRKYLEGQFVEKALSSYVRKVLLVVDRRVQHNRRQEITELDLLDGILHYNPYRSHAWRQLTILGIDAATLSAELKTAMRDLDASSRPLEAISETPAAEQGSAPLPSQQRADASPPQFGPPLPPPRPTPTPSPPRFAPLPPRPRPAPPPPPKPKARWMYMNLSLFQLLTVDSRSMLAGALKLADPNPISAEHLMVAMSSYECSANTFLKEAGFETTKPQTKIDVSGATFVTDVRFDPELASFFLEIARDAGLPKHTPVNSLYFLLALLRLSQRGTLKTSLTDATSTQRLRELSEKLVLAIAPKEENIATPKIASPIQQAVTTTNAMQAINDRLNSLLERGAGGQVITRDPELMYVCDRVLQTLRIAYLESRLLRQTQVDTAHILLGVTAVVEDTEPEYALPNRDLLESFRKKLIAQQAKIAAENASENPLDTQSMSCIKPEVIRLLETADKIVRGLGHYFMDIHHIALATMNSSNCELNSILGGHNMTGGLLGNNLMRCLDALNKIQRYRAQPTVGLRPPNLASVCLPLHDSERDPNSVPKHRLSAAMRCVLIDAAKDAEMFDGGKTCLRHLMLGLFLQKKEQSQTGTILLNMGVKLRARSTNEQGQNRRDSGFLSSRAISVLRRSWSITSKMGDWSIQPEHLLLAFADEADRLAFLIFEELELDPKELRSRAKEALSERKFRS